ncbi:MAG: cation-translocating P-type ATPase [Sedimentisphaerales bacterium]|jgi:Cd2+/Zn2+-exporting ATPase|nr:cation-translocating P-type ATPase [Sedimentisphaerales bacterium]HNY79225.1 cation-translocating P-type ATPase [Sedimentisphaerales bacterium]HOC61513.1 cation-translocating P-type ATPase [Sedimentisphaerales bacterium]HOH65223.1 cation-translocating P-type ATPase [Sedimentisphaerales bacterium]HPY50102.1 cation-translocating P-type ATPase [Sedimentisphaerales bacterium]
MAHEHLHLQHDTAEETRGQQLRVSLALLGTLAGGVLLINSGIGRFIYGPDSFNTEIFAMLGALLLGLPIVVHAILSLIRGESHMDELAALGIVAAFATGEYVAAGLIGFFMLLSELIETRTALGARASIESLIKLTPTRANLVSADGVEQEVKVSALKPGDLIRVRPGDNIPADGEVATGLSSVNEATITGESLPVDKVPGMQVFAGTNNLTGAMDIRVTKAGHDTTLGKVQSLIMQAEHTKIPIMRIIDRYITWYVPTILMIAAIVLFFTRDINQAITILVISCPCAIILATPTAMVAAISAAARLGVLVKNVADLEIAGKMTALVFDKTGTVTTGRLYVTKLTPAEGIEPAELLAEAAAAEQLSKHPAARALHDVAKEANLSLPVAEGFQETPGKGVTATVNSSRILVGRETFLKENGVDFAGITDPALDEEQGFSTLYVAKDARCIGWIGLQDKTRPEAQRAVKELVDIGIKRVTMLTGDRSEVANRVAGELGCTDYKAHCLPQDKLAIVEQIKRDGHTVVVVGDGINDAPALAAGDLGIAMGAAGSDVAINSASIALMNNDLRRIPFLVQVSRRTRRVINQNLGFGIAFIVFGISLAKFIPPSVAAFLHFASSLVVVFNSARLVRYGEDLDHESRPVGSSSLEA